MTRGPTSFILRMYDGWTLQCLAFGHEAFVVFSELKNIAWHQTALLFTDAKLDTSILWDQEINMQSKPASGASQLALHHILRDGNGYSSIREYDSGGDMPVPQDDPIGARLRARIAAIRAHLRGRTGASAPGTTTLTRRRE